MEGDAEDLPFEDASFDMALSTLGVMFAPDQEKAARELQERAAGTMGDRELPYRRKGIVSDPPSRITSPLPLAVCEAGSFGRGLDA